MLSNKDEADAHQHDKYDLVHRGEGRLGENWFKQVATLPPALPYSAALPGLRVLPLSTVGEHNLSRSHEMSYDVFWRNRFRDTGKQGLSPFGNTGYSVFNNSGRRKHRMALTEPGVVQRQIVADVHPD